MTTQIHTPETWFISDLHLGDEKIIPACRHHFTSVEEMDELLIRQWRRHVHPDDEIFVLGDFTGSSSTSRERGLAHLAQLPGRKVLVPGNHEPMHDHDPGSSGWTAAARPYLDAGFAEVLPGPVPDHAEAPTRHWAFTLSHFPCHQAYFEVTDRYRAHRPPDIGSLVIHGHVHDAWKVLTTSAGTIQINVSPEVSSYAPTRLDSVLSLASHAVRAQHDQLSTQMRRTSAAALVGDRRA